MIGRCVLVVDDDRFVTRSLLRSLQSDFGTVLTADCPESAERLLRQFQVTHLVCDYDLGGRWPRGTQLIHAWRKKYPSIRKALLYTGSPTGEIPLGLGIDRVLRKGEQHDLLITELGRPGLH